MPKTILQGHSIYVAHQMLGFWKDRPCVQCERNSPELVELDPEIYADKILIYERQVQDWFLNPARRLLSDMGFQAGFVILSICLSYLEGVEQYRRGESSTGKTSRDFFCSSFKRVFGDKMLDDERIHDFYKDARCGLFHDGMTRSGVIADMDLKTPIEMVDFSGTTRICFQPSFLLNSIEYDFKAYIRDLRADPVALGRDPNRRPSSVLGKNFYAMYKLS
jgi:hypothetical protein